MNSVVYHVLRPQRSYLTFCILEMGVCSLYKDSSIFYKHNKEECTKKIIILPSKISTLPTNGHLENNAPKHFLPSKSPVQPTSPPKSGPTHPIDRLLFHVLKMPKEQLMQLLSISMIKETWTTKPLRKSKVCIPNCWMISAGMPASMAKKVPPPSLRTTNLIKALLMI